MGIPESYLIGRMFAVRTHHQALISLFIVLENQKAAFGGMKLILV
jgi:hypothetical protein